MPAFFYPFSDKVLVLALLLAIGIFAFGIGISSSRSVADQVSNTFIGRFTDTTTWYLLGGIAAAVFGLMLVSFGYRGKKS